MTAQIFPNTTRSHDPFADPTHAVDAAHERVVAHALTPTPGGRVGLELEFHLVDLARPQRRPEWDEVLAAAASLPPMPSGSSVTLEPGGQVELSTPPTEDVASSVAALRADREVLSRGLAAAGYGAAPLGPVLVAASSASPYLAGTSSGWHSMRQQIWHGIDHHRSEPVPADAPPTEAWAAYALDAPVMLVRDADAVRPVLERVPFRAWLRGDAPLNRRPTVDDLDYHLTTLFPPVRPRGYLEIRCIDALPDRWWPALAALTTILIDDEVASDAAVELTAPVADAWAAAARDGLGDAAVRRAVTGCVLLALEHCPDALRPELSAFAELVESGRTPADVLRARADEVGPLRLLEEEARA